MNVDYGKPVIMAMWIITLILTQKIIMLLSIAMMARIILMKVVKLCLITILCCDPRAILSCCILELGSAVARIKTGEIVDVCVHRFRMIGYGAWTTKTLAAPTCVW